MSFSFPMCSSCEKKVPDHSLYWELQLLWLEWTFFFWMKSLTRDESSFSVINRMPLSRWWGTEKQCLVITVLIQTWNPFAVHVAQAGESAGREIISGPLSLSHHLLLNYTTIRSGIITLISIIIAQNTLVSSNHNAIRKFKAHQF